MSRHYLVQSVWVSSILLRAIYLSMMVSASVMLLGNFVHAQLSYTDPNTFLSASGATAEAAMPDNGVAPSVMTQVVGGMTFTHPTDPSLSFRDTWTSLTAGNDLAISGVEDFNVDFGSAITSIGFEWVDATTATTSLDITFLSGGAGGTVIDTANFSGPANALNFQGYVTSQPFDRIEIREVGDDAANEYWGQFFTGALAKSWVNAGNGNWDIGANWTGGTVPAASDYAFIAPSTAVTVTGPAAATTVAGLTVDNTGASATVLDLQASGPLTVSNDVFVGQSGTSSIVVPNGGTLNVGGDTTVESSGTLTLASGATFNPTGDTILDGGSINVDSISQLSSSPAITWNSGVVAVTGAGGFSATSGGPLGPTVDLTAGQTLDVTNTVSNAFSIDINGGTLDSGAVVNQFGLAFTINSGSVSTGSFDNTLGGITNINGGTVSASSFDSSTGTLNFTGGTLSIDGGTFTPRTAPPGPDFVLNGTSNPTLEFINGASTNIGGDLDVGGADDGTLNILSGSTVTNDNGAIAETSSAGTGTVLVDGAGSTWTNNGTLDVGQGNSSATSDDILTVDNDGAVIINGTTTIGSTGRVELNSGSITVNNGNLIRNSTSQFIHTGGTLTINNGDFQSGESTFTLGGVDRPEIVLANNTTHAGGSIDVGNGDWTVESGSSVTASSLDIFNNGAGDPGKVTVDGQGSRWDLTNASTGALDVGITTSGDGELTISNGGVVTSFDLRVAASNSSTGLVTVTDPNSRLTITAISGDSHIGGSASTGSGTDGDVEVLNGGTLTFVDDLFIASFGGSNGKLKVEGAGSNVIVGEGDASNNDFLVVGDEGVGVLEIRNGGSVQTEQLFLGNDAGGNGTVLIGDPNETVGGASLEVTGIADIGDADFGSLIVSNGATFTTSSMGNEIARIGVSLGVNDSSVTVSGAGTTWTHMGTGRIRVGQGGGTQANPSLLTISEGGLVDVPNGDFYVTDADANDGYGKTVINGAGSRLSVGGGAVIGDDNDAELEISGGGRMDVVEFIDIGGTSDGGGTALITGRDPNNVASLLNVTNDLAVGRNSPGAMDVEAGGRVQSDNGWIAEAAGSSGTATVGSVTADTSTWATSAELHVGGSTAGQGGPGFLNVNSGGLVEVGTELKVWNTGTVNLDGGTIELASLDIVSSPDFNFNSGTLRFTGSKALDSLALDDIFGGGAYTLGSSQSLEIVGAATITTELRLNGGILSVGSTTPGDLANLDWDAGTLNITNENAVVGAAGQLGNSVIVNQAQSLGVPNNTLTVDSGADLNVIRGGLSTANATNNGLMIVSNTSAVDFDSDNDPNGSGLTNNGDLVLINATTSGAIVNNGTIEIVGGGSLVESLTQGSGGTLGIDINSLASFDSLAVSGDATLGGTLDVDVNASLSVGDSFEILDVSGNLTGTFNGFADGALVDSFGGLNLVIDYDGGDGNDVVLFAALAGDFDLSGTVDGLDFLLWQQGGSPTPLSQSDLSDWEANYGTTASVATSTSVPEPSAVFLLCTCALGMVLGRNRWV